MALRYLLLALVCAAPIGAAQGPGPGWAKGYQLELDASGITRGYGTAVALDGDLAVVGQTSMDTSGPSLLPGQPQVHVFRESADAWNEEAILTASVGHLEDGYATTLALQGERLVVGAPDTMVTSSGQGAVYVYAFDGTTWVEEAVLIGPDEIDYQFGTSVALHRRELVVGGERVRVYERFGQTWVFKTEVEEATGEAAFDGRTIMTVASPPEARFFERSPEVELQGGTQAPAGPVFTEPTKVGAWELVAALEVPVMAGVFFAFGHPTLDRDVAAVGAYPTFTIGAQGIPGEVHVFERSGGTWEIRQRLEPSDGGSLRFFGQSIAIDGDTILIGAPAQATTGFFPDPLLDQPGAVYEYFRTGTSPSTPWEQGRRFETRFDDALNPTVLLDDPAGGVFMVNELFGFDFDSVSRVAPGGLQVDVLLEYFPGELGADQPVALANGTSGELYVANRTANNVLEIDGSVVTELIDVTGDGLGNPFSSPSAMVVGFGGAVFVSGASSDNVFKITPGGTITEILDTTGDGETPLGTPLELNIFPTGALIVAGNSNVFSVDQIGDIDLLFKPSDVEPAPFSNLQGMATDSTGNIFISGLSTHNVVEIRSPGLAQVVVGDAIVRSPSTLRVDAADNLYILCREPGVFAYQVVKRAPDGSISVALDQTGNGVASLGVLLDIAVAPDGTLYAATVEDVAPGSQTAYEGRLFEVAPDGTTSLTLAGLQHWGSLHPGVNRRLGTSVDVHRDLAVVGADEFSFDMGYPGYSGYDNSGPGAAYIYDVSQPTELLVIGDGPGRSSFVGSSHEFTTQVGPLVEDAWPVDAASQLEFVLPDPDDETTADLVPHWMLDGRFSVQLLSWDPDGNPSQPERWSQGLAVSVTPDGQVTTTAYGRPQGDVHLRVEITRNAQGQRVLRLPYNLGR